MLRQATQGDVDVITGDYLAEWNLATNAVARAKGQHEGWEPTAWDGLQQTIEVLDKKRIKVVINGGALNPEGLARKVQGLVAEKGLHLKVAYVFGDDLTQHVKTGVEETGSIPAHLDSENANVILSENTTALLNENQKIVSAHAYLGARGIVRALELGADIVICGRVADASPVIGAAWYWFNWQATNYDNLAGALIAGHLIECSAYVTGCNFSGFDEYPTDTFIDVPYGIAEISSDGTSVITKHANTKGLVNEDTTRCQFLYELQGIVYLNSDVSADIQDIMIEPETADRVRLSNIRGRPPPPTTKLAIFYHGGYESQFLLNAAGYATTEKWDQFKTQSRYFIDKSNLMTELQLLDLQVIGTAADNPRSQLSSTTYLRIFAQADTEQALIKLTGIWNEIGLQHFSGLHLSWDTRTAAPRQYLAYYPGLYSQDEIKEGVVLLGSSSSERDQTIHVDRPPKYEKLSPRVSYETESPDSLESFGPTSKARLGDAVLARSGDKAANINIGLFVRKPEHYPWLQSFMTCQRLQTLIGGDWKEGFYLERVEFKNILAVHFVIYGPLERGVSSTRHLDAFGKGFADYIRAKVVDVPQSILADMESIKQERRSRILKV